MVTDRDIYVSTIVIRYVFDAIQRVQEIVPDLSIKELKEVILTDAQLESKIIRMLELYAQS